MVVLVTVGMQRLLILFVRPTREFFTHMETSPFLMKGCKLHEASVTNGHLRGPVTLIPYAERLAVELSLPIFTT